MGERKQALRASSSSTRATTWPPPSTAREAEESRKHPSGRSSEWSCKTGSPNARVVYASATGATEVANLAYAARLGLWGRGTPFPTVEAFVEKVSAGGIAAMELVAKDLKSMGLYLARSVSYDGVDYRTLVHDLEDHQAQTYDRCAQAWQVVLRNIQQALEVTKADKCGRARAAAYSQFWGAHQRFFLHVLVSMSAPSLIRDMEARLAAGESCVVQLVSTMEAATERAYAKAVANGDDLRDLDVTPRDQLLQFVEASFPTTLYEEYQDDEGRVRSRPVQERGGDFVQSPEVVAGARPTDAGSRSGVRASRRARPGRGPLRTRFRGRGDRSRAAVRHQDRRWH